MDIRPYLKPFSWEIYKNSKIAFSNTLNKNVAYNKSDEITFEEYLINLNFFLLDKRTYSLFPFIKKVHQYITKVLKDKKINKKNQVFLIITNILVKSFLILKINLVI